MMVALAGSLWTAPTRSLLRDVPAVHYHVFVWVVHNVVGADMAGVCRNMLGLNDDQFSYVVGMGFDSASFPRQPLVRPAAGPTAFGGGPNQQVLRGAIVNGPDASGNYQDSRQRPCAPTPPQHARHDAQA